MKCHICKKVAFSTAKAINEHIQKKHPKYRFFCLHCPKNFETANGCYNHELKHKAKKYICEMCTKACSLKNLSYTLKFTQKRICTSVPTVQDITPATTTCWHIRPPIRIKYFSAQFVEKSSIPSLTSINTHPWSPWNWVVDPLW